MKRILLAAAIATLAASPAFAGCVEDAQAQAQKVQTLSQGLMSKAQAPQAEQCSAMKEVMDETQKLVGLYKGCQADLKLTDAQIQQLDQQVATGQQGYSAQCGG
ncbi:hypothetical protein [Inquilinus limosus]|uniref:Uncharacterized protein n=1 Tax=Inquilinus limosus TaxID=171674 RepID=A0A211ZJ39_9PROT|nr:hypothetical protein [Inquilinus limosus]OWJ65315.1 hypothetical protein BWR60_20155 [Inquilinus limosus]